MSALARGYDRGLVVRYQPDPSRHDPMWCREGQAVGTGGIEGFLADTYWGSGGDAHLLTVEETESMTVLGHLSDYRLLGRGEPVTDYAPDDRLLVTHQHGLQRDHYVRIGAVVSYRARITEQVRRVREARDEATRAARRTEWIEDDLRRLLAERGQ